MLVIKDNTCLANGKANTRIGTARAIACLGVLPDNDPLTSGRPSLGAKNDVSIIAKTDTSVHV